MGTMVVKAQPSMTMATSMTMTNHSRSAGLLGSDAWGTGGARRGASSHRAKARVAGFVGRAARLGGRRKPRARREAVGCDGRGARPRPRNGAVSQQLVPMGRASLGSADTSGGVMSTRVAPLFHAVRLWRDELLSCPPCKMKWVLFKKMMDH